VSSGGFVMVVCHHKGNALGETLSYFAVVLFGLPPLLPPQ
jgi:hypothetical protein